MAAPRIDRWLTCIIKGVTGTEGWENVLSFSTLADIGDPVTLASVLADFVARVLPHYLDCMANTSTVNSVTMRTNYPTATNYEVVYPLTPPSPGTRTGDSMPQNSTPVVSWRSPAIGRSFRGRSYIGGMADNDADNSVLHTSLISALGALATAVGTWVGPLPANPTTFVVASRKLLTLVPIVSAIVDLYTKSQRTRLPQERKHHKKHIP